MKNYCIGLFFIVFVAFTIVPAFFYYAMHNMANTDIFTKPGWFYGLALVTALISAYLCERKTGKRRKSLHESKEKT